MNVNDYEAVWKRQELPVGASADLDQLRATFEPKRRKLAATLLVRDLLEASAGFVVAAAYGHHWWKLGKSGWPLAGGILLILGVSFFFVRERLRARSCRLSPDATLLAKVSADIDELRHQCRLVRTVWMWYLAPIAGALAIHFTVIIRHAPAWSPLHEPRVIVGFSVFFGLLFCFVWTINRRALRKRLEPRLLELEKLHRDLLSIP